MSLKPKAPTGPFFTEEMRAWLGGYTPVVAAEICGEFRGKPATPETRKAHAQGQLFRPLNQRSKPWE